MKRFKKSNPAQEPKPVPTTSEPAVKVRTIELSGTVCHALSLTQEAYGLREQEDFARSWGHVDIRIEERCQSKTLYQGGDSKIVHLKGTLVEPIRSTQPFGGGTNEVEAACTFEGTTRDGWFHWKPVSVRLDPLYVYDIEEYVDDEQWMWIRYRLKEHEEPFDDDPHRYFTE